VFDPRDPDPDYQLVWPADLFRREAEDILSRPPVAFMPTLSLLLSEAFVGPQPERDLWAQSEPWEFGLSTESAFVQSILDNLDRLPTEQPAPYWISRRSGSRDRLEEPQTSLQQDWSRIMTGLIDRGYLEKTTGPIPASAQHDRVGELIAERTGLDSGLGARLLGLPSADTAPDEFSTAVEVIHDLVARPRTAATADDGRTTRHDNFSVRAGQAVCRWRVNEAFDQHGVELQLSDSGEDRGRLVQSYSDPRRELVEQVRQEAPSGVDHAIALYRRRGASVDDKRSACIALARILESRRQLLKSELLSKDEGALFQIANQFSIRHQNADQRSDYDEAYLDWLFWWYLGTVELTNRLIARDAAR